MSKFKGTPGPWGVRESSLSVSVVGQNGEVVFHESDKRIPGVMEDARLISAAPELLESLQYAVDVLEDLDMNLLHNVVENGKAAIAKALGEDAP